MAATVMLKPTEAAVVAGVPLREVNRVIDEGILPEDFLDRAGGRRIAAAACLLIAFYVDTADQLTVKARRFVIDEVSIRLRKRHAILVFPSNDDWTVKDQFLAIDLKPLVRSVSERWEQLSAAEELVTSSPEILGGMLIIKGTRVPVYDVAASVESGISNARILDAYPSLTAKQVALAALYAKANPPRGRPRGPAPLPKSTRLITNRTVHRRRKAG